MKSAEYYRDKLGDLVIPTHGKLNFVDYDRAVDAILRECQADVLEAAALECEYTATQMQPFDPNDPFPRKNFAAEAIRKLKPTGGA